MAGMNEHLSKPLEMDKVVSVIAKYRGYREDGETVVYAYTGSGCRYHLFDNGQKPAADK